MTLSITPRTPAQTRTLNTPYHLLPTLKTLTLIIIGQGAALTCTLSIDWLLLEPFIDVAPHTMLLITALLTPCRFTRQARAIFLNKPKLTHTLTIVSHSLIVIPRGITLQTCPLCRALYTPLADLQTINTRRVINRGVVAMDTGAAGFLPIDSPLALDTVVDGARTELAGSVRLQGVVGLALAGTGGCVVGEVGESVAVLAAIVAETAQAPGH